MLYKRGLSAIYGWMCLFSALLSLSSSNTMDNTTTNTTTKSKIRWAPLNIPLERRLQMVALCTWFFALWICLLVFGYLWTFPWLWPFLIAYLTFVYLDKAPEMGGRRVEWIRRLPTWKYFANYFPAKLIKVHL